MGCLRERPPRVRDVDVDEGDTAVTVTATVEAAPPSTNCTGSQLFTIPVNASLKQPLGERRVLDGSCSPPEAVVIRTEDRSPCDPSPREQAMVGAVGAWTRFDAGPLATRGEPRAVWTGKEMIVVGGLAIEHYAAFNDAAAYDPTSDRWRKLAPRPDRGRIMGVAWTGTEVFALGQKDGIALEDMRSAHLYNPTSNSWRPVRAHTSGFNAPDAYWTGTEVLVWQLGSGALYNPATDTWRDLPPTTVPGATAVGRARWLDGAGVLAVQAAINPDNGGPLRAALLLFDPVTTTWRKAADLPEQMQQFHFLYAAWLGTDELFNSGNVTLAYDPRLDRWRRVDLPKGDGEEGPMFSHGTPIGRGRGVVRAGDSNRPLWLFDGESGRWAHASSPTRKLPAGDGVLMWTGRDVLLWGRPGEATATDPNSAWKWTPPEAS